MKKKYHRNKNGHELQITPIGDIDYSITVDFKLYCVLSYLLARKYNFEFTVLSHCDRDQNDFTLYDYFIPKQSNNSTQTIYDSESVIELMSEGADFSKLTGHIHSHVNMPVYDSLTDFNDIVEAAELSGVLCRLVVNKDGEMYGHIADHENGLHIGNIPVLIDTPISRDQFDKSVLKIVKQAESLEEIKRIMATDFLEFCEREYGLTEQEKIAIEQKVRQNFSILKTAKSTGSYNNYPAIKRLNDNPAVRLTQQSEYDDLFEQDIFQGDFSRDDLDAMGIPTDVLDAWDYLDTEEKRLIAEEGWSLDDINQKREEMFNY